MIMRLIAAMILGCGLVGLMATGQWFAAIAIFGVWAYFYLILWAYK